MVCCNNFINIISWNVQGLIHKSINKIKDPIFLREIQDCHIIALTETHSINNEDISIPGFKLIKKGSRPTKGDKGGTAIYARNDIKKFVKPISQSSPDVIWCVLPKEFFGLETNTYICCFYSSPRNSPWLNKNDEPFDTLEYDIAKYSDMGQVVVTGDFNIRVGKRDDSLSEDLNIPIRNSCDTKFKNGNLILDLCRSYNLVITNGRLMGDLNGSYTSYQPAGNSVVDYVIVSSELFFQFRTLTVGNKLFISDHSSLKSSFVCKYNTNDDDANNLEGTIPLPNYWKCNSENMLKFANMFKSDDIDNNVEELLKNMSDQEINDELINNMTNGITSTFQNVASKTLVKTRNHKKRKKNKFWFNTNCRDLRKELLKIGRHMKKDPNDINIRQTYFINLKRYKYSIRKAKSEMKENLTDKMNDAFKKDSKSFWSLVKRLKSQDSKDKTNPIDIASWVKHFTKLNNPHQKNATDDLVKEIVKEISEENYFSKLDYVISQDEVMSIIKILKNGKSPGIDGITYEMIKSASPKMVKLITKLFNNILCYSIFPTQWKEGYIVPIPKQGDKYDPDNYRGLTLSSCLCKLFCKVINRRITNHLIENNILAKNQLGFVKGKRTSDHIFTVKAIIDKYVSINRNNKNKSRKLFVCFVDISKAFDKIWRDGLFYKLLLYGIKGKMFKIISSMYENVLLRILVNKNLSPLIDSHVGTKQGDPLSSTLFNIYMNDIPSIFDQSCAPITINDFCKTNILQYADDIIILSETEIGLQNSLNKLGIYCHNWKLSISKKKTKIMVFSPSGKILPNSVFKLNDQILEIAQSYTYLGVIFQSNGTFKNNLEERLKKGKKCRGGIMEAIISNNMNLESSNHIYDLSAVPSLLYCAEVWGIFHSTKRSVRTSVNYKIEEFFLNHCIEIEHRKFMRFALGTSKNSCNMALYGETGKYPLYINIFKQALKYFFHIMESPPDSFLYQSFMHNSQSADLNSCNWSYQLKSILEYFGFGHVWDNKQSLNINKTIKAFENKMKDKFRSYWTNYLEIQKRDNKKLYEYIDIKTSFGTPAYIGLIKDFRIRRAITKIRICDLRLDIETLRYVKPLIPRENRICKHCINGPCENEQHFLMDCTKHNTLRQKLFPDILDLNFHEVLKSESRLVLIKLGKFINQAMRNRASLNPLNFCSWTCILNYV